MRLGLQYLKKNLYLRTLRHCYWIEENFWKLILTATLNLKKISIVKLLKTEDSILHREEVCDANK
ncbi:hypothetical protein ABEB36_014047 [Hypothenemus hampei]|uniref:Transposase DDE domain-containing protein n=1 Tax=Hypothenemus hampei TaxID=57062 RepID=A0ABD1E351_HYPHA